MSEYQDALQAVNDARQGLEEKALAAQEAHRANPNAETREAKDKAVADLQAARQVERAGGRQLVVGDVFVHDDPDARDDSPQPKDRGYGGSE